MSVRNFHVLLTGGMAAAALLLACGEKETEPEPTPPVMKQITGGTFTMGRDTDTLVFLGAHPAHSVSVTTFYMDSTEVTQADYWALMLMNPWKNSISGNLLPASCVSWFDAVLYCNARSKYYKKDTVYRYSSAVIDEGNSTCDTLAGLTIDMTKNGYRLPTEAEWEYACRAGGSDDYYWGRSYPPVDLSDTSAMDNYAVWINNSMGGTVNVATKYPNAWGLYDMCGNVTEWCNDWFHETYYTSDPSTDPTGADTCYVYATNLYCRALRGGGYDNGFAELCSAARGFNGQTTNNVNAGFRCVCR